eukprot:g35313.t1
MCVAGMQPVITLLGVTTVSVGQDFIQFQNRQERPAQVMAMINTQGCMEMFIGTGGLDDWAFVYVGVVVVVVVVVEVEVDGVSL